MGRSPGTVHHKRRTEPAPLTVSRAVEVWRALLARPWHKAFQTDAEFTRQLLADGRRAPLVARTLPRSLLRRPVSLAVAVRPSMRVADDGQSRLLKALDADLLVSVVRLAPSLPPILAPVTFLLSRPLAAAEQEQVTTRQAEILQAFEAKVTQSRPILERLAARGADPAYVLSVLLRYTARRGAEFPEGAIDFRRAPLTVTLPPRARARRIGRGATVFPAALSWVLPLPPASPRRRRRGPAQTVTSVGMAVLRASVLVHPQDQVAVDRRTQTGRPTAREIAELFGIWTARPFAARHVYDRVREVRKKFPGQLRRLLREEEAWRRASAALR